MFGLESFLDFELDRVFGSSFCTLVQVSMKGLFGKRAVQCFKDNRNQRTTFWAFNLFEGLNVFVFGAVHD